MNEIISRLKEFISYAQLTPRAFAIKIGFNYSTLNNYFTGRRTTIDIELISKTISTFDNLSVEWLLRGKGEMLIAEEQPSEAGNERLGKLIDTIALLQETVNNYKERLGTLEARNKRLEAELAMFKNERLIG